MLTDRQIVALRWMRDFPSNKAGWRRNGKAAYGPPEKWDAMQISGRQGSIEIPVEDWTVIHGLTQSIPTDDKIYAPTAEALQLIQ